MPVHVHDAPLPRLSPAERAHWAQAEAAAVSDCLERGMAMDAGIAPLAPSMRVVGRARAIRCMVGDNSALHAAIPLVEPDDVLVADAGGFLGDAVWGGLMSDAARRRGIAGLVLDGAARDGAEIIEMGFPVFARGRAPAGPHKAFGGAIDRPVSCGGVAVRSGDLVIADADGVTIVPHERLAETARAYAALKHKEARARAALAAGGTLAEVYGLPEIVRVPSAR